MSSVTLDRLATDIEQLSLQEQLLLLERLAHHIRSRTMPVLPTNADALAAMAADPAIQRELRQIADEFAVADADGLAAY